jgi:hypothetical protein
VLLGCRLALKVRVRKNRHIACDHAALPAGRAVDHEDVLANGGEAGCQGAGKRNERWDRLGSGHRRLGRLVLDPREHDGVHVHLALCVHLVECHHATDASRLELGRF